MGVVPIELQKLGEPIDLNEYLEHYELLAKYVLQELTFSDWKNPDVKERFDMEMVRSETQWFAFFEKEGRPPDYAFLQNEITNFGIERAPNFERIDEGLSVDNFVHFHIEQLKLDNLLSLKLIEPKDLKFVEKFERNKAKNHFMKRDKLVKGYENFRISKNQTMQQAAYQQLKIDFVNDPVLIPYQKKEVVDLAVNDERVAEFVLDSQKKLLRAFINLAKSAVKGTAKGTIKTVKVGSKVVSHQMNTGKQRYSRLKKQGTLEHVDVSKTDLKPVMQEMKKYKIDFSVKENPTTGKTHIFFKAKDRDTLNIALENVVQKFDKELSQEKEAEKALTPTKEQEVTPSLSNDQTKNQEQQQQFQSNEQLTQQQEQQQQNQHQQVPQKEGQTQNQPQPGLDDLASLAALESLENSLPLETPEEGKGGLTDKLDQLEVKAQQLNQQRAEKERGSKGKDKGQER